VIGDPPLIPPQDALAGKVPGAWSDRIEWEQAPEVIVWSHCLSANRHPLRRQML